MNSFVNIYAETVKEGILPGVYELIDKAFEIKREDEKCVNVLLIGDNVQVLASEINQYGADNVWFLERSDIHKGMEDIYIDILEKWIKTTKPEALLCCSTVHSKSIMPRIAVRLNTGLCADCLDIKINNEGRFVFRRTARDGDLIADIIVPNTNPQMATIKSNVLKTKRNKNISKGLIYNFGRDSLINNSKYYIKNRIDNCHQNSYNLENAKIVVVVGMGIEKKENLDLIYDFVSVIKGAQLGATRKVVEKGWVDPSKQVGQTGVILNAELCILCGVSGAIQHKVGLARCKKVVAINIDENAMIFQYADYGIVGNLFEVIPQMIEDMRDIK